MPVSESYKEFIEEKLSKLPGVSMKRMFGGAGVFHGGKMFAVLSDDQLLLKVNDDTKQDFIDRGSRQLNVHKKGKGMPYYQVPPDVLEDDQLFIAWSQRSIDIAHTK